MPETPCVLWAGRVRDDGYGTRGTRLAHRAAWEDVHGPIPEGIELDHTCEVRSCVNIDHLEPVTHAENIRRTYERGRGWQQLVTHCPAGHSYAEHGRIYVSRDGVERYCRRCKTEKSRVRRARLRALA